MHNKDLHVPVLPKEIITYLRLKKGMVIVDCTIGVGGHAEKILKEIGSDGYLIGIDRDKEALSEANARLKDISDRFRLFHSNFADIDLVLKEAGIQKINGALFDLGVSSYQMDKPERGFSIRLNGPLDMRMNTDDKLKASDIVNGYTRPGLVTIFQKYGDERLAGRIADRIVKARDKARISNTSRLAEIVTEALPYHYRFRKIHPATRVFMALRIAVNRETESLEKGLTKTVSLLDRGGRICVISFHSIEDRIAKNSFKEFAKLKKLRIITKKPIQPSAGEIEVNPRARSAKLRVGERI